MISYKRVRIDIIDDRILTLLEERFQVTDEIGRMKVTDDIPIQHDHVREEEITNRLKRNNPSIHPEFIESLYELIFDYAVKRQKI